MSYRCGTCSNSTRSSLDVARLAGWRIWDGKSQTGKPMSVRICPVCSGVEERKPEPSWRVGCDTCGWEYEEWDDDGPLTEKQANDMAIDHQCEPDTWVKPPPTPEEQAKEQELIDRLAGQRRVATVPVAGVS